MERVVRRRLEMIKSVRDFCRAHPSTDANYAAVLVELEELITHMEALATQQQDGVVTAHASTVRRKALRRRLHHELLRHLVTVAGVAAADQPGLAERYHMPRGNETNEVFRTLARRLLTQGRTEQEVLAKHGLADKLLDDLSAAVDEFDVSVAQSNEGRRGHVGARAELKAVSDEAMQQVEMLDGLNRYRFGGKAELLAAWESARNVVAGPRAAAGAPAEPAGGAPEVPAGGVRPAA
ncbi:MAG: hypothetical protein ACJ8DC_01425 [Gemmatimonadales bacterium]